jgi:hypothetical protein
MMIEDEYEALQVIWIASRVINRHQYGISMPQPEIDALRQLAQTDEERALPPEVHARRIIDSLILSQAQRRKTAA